MPISQPPLIEVPFAESGLKNAIPANANNVTGNAGFDLGFPPINLTAVAAGGIPPFGQDMNGILYEITQNIQYQQTGTAFVYSSAFASAIGGYPIGATLLKADGSGEWVNTVADNLTDPDAGGAGWVERPFSAQQDQVQIFPVNASVAGNALTISAPNLTLEFRSTSLGSGIPTVVTGTPSSLTISSGSTLGTISGVQSDIVVLAINNSGTIELAAVNIAGGVNLSETGLVSTTAEGGAGGADSANVIYSNSARSNLAYRVIGFIRSTQATAGAWATAPSLVQGAGGNSLTSMSSIGFGQAWQVVTRSSGVNYYNNTGKPIILKVDAVGSTPNAFCNISINGVSVGSLARSDLPSGTPVITGSILIPVGASYLIADTNIASRTSYELR